MAKSIITVPAISREIEFIAHHANDADAVRADKNFEPKWLKKLTDKVYVRADADVQELLLDLEDEITHVLNKIIHLPWKRYKFDWWEVNSPVYLSQRHRKEIGWLFLTVSFGTKSDPRIIGSFILNRGGQDALQRFSQFCRNRKLRVHLVGDNRANYAIWEGGDGIVWFDKKVSSKDSREALKREIGKSAKEFFKIAKLAIKAILST
jgi:hypothetical protein